MTPERWQQIDHLFHVALAHEPAQRAGFLNSACDGDEPLRRELESLISSHEGAQNFIEAPAGDVAAEVLGKPQSRSEPGEQIDNYKIVRHLGSGGMGEVYLADDTRLNRKIALKLLPPHFTVDHGRVRRFDQEARAASALNHPNIVTIHEIGQTDSLHYIATEFVDGETLREHLSNTRMTVGDVLDVAGQIASALQAAHEAGIVHRDIKPENIMLRRDRIVKVLDFGLAKLAPIDQQATIKLTVNTSPGVVMGTVAYMSPEQARGNEVDARTDIWSLGVVLFEMVARRVPFKGDTPSHVIVSILENELPSLSDDSGVPAELERIISKSLRKDPAERYQAASDMALDLKKLKEDLTIDTRLKQFKGPPDSDEKINGHAAFATTRASTVRTSELSGAHSMSSAEYFLSGIKRHKGSAVFASIAGLFLVASLVYFTNFTRRNTEAIDSVAVLHFVNEGEDPQAEYLAAGLSESIINSISQLPNLRVISLNAVSRYKGRQVDPQTMGQELKVRAVLILRMSHRADALEISTELVDVRDNSHLWGAQYKKKASDLLELQKEIVGEIAEKLHLGDAEKQRLTKQYTTSTEAYDAFARGRAMYEKRTGPATYKSIEHLERAIKLDPNYALAYAYLSHAYLSLRTLGVNLPKEEVFPKAREAAAKALALDGTLAEANTAMGRILGGEGDSVGAGNAFKRGIELNPNSGFAHSGYSMYLKNIGRLDEAVAECIRAVELEPTSVLYNRNLGVTLYFARRYDEAIEQSLKTLELDPNMPTAYRWLARSYEQKKLYDKAIDAYLKTAEFGPEVEASFREVYAKSGWIGFWRKSLDLKKERAQQKKISVVALAETYVRIGELNQAIALLEETKTLLGGDPFGGDPFWDHLRTDPRYQHLFKRMADPE